MWLMLARCGLPFLLAVGAAARCGAGEGLFLTWGDCAQGVAAVSGLAIPCDTDIGDNRLYLAFSLSQPVDQVLGIEVVVDIQSEADPLPDWWHFEAAGPTFPQDGCRKGALLASRDFGADRTCVDPWAGTTGDALVQDYEPGQPGGVASRARIRATAFLVSPGPALALDATHQYYGLKLILSNARTSVCSGCDKAACLVLNSIWLKRPGAPGGDILLTVPGPQNANWARWQGGSNLDCSAVPARRMTWGRVKSLYRR